MSNNRNWRDVLLVADSVLSDFLDSCHQSFFSNFDVVCNGLSWSSVSCPCGCGNIITSTVMIPVQRRFFHTISALKHENPLVSLLILLPILFKKLL